MFLPYIRLVNAKTAKEEVQFYRLWNISEVPMPEHIVTSDSFSGKKLVRNRWLDVVSTAKYQNQAHKYE